jgi:hypothetical protein
LFLDGSNGQRRRLDGLVVKGLDHGLLTILDLPGVCPLSVGLVDNVLLFALGVEGSGEGVLLARNPALAAVVDLRGVACRGLDVGAAV